MNSRQDLILNWLKNIKWESLTEWEQEFVDALWVKDKIFTMSQTVKLDEVYDKHRGKKINFPVKSCISEYEYIHDFDK